MKKINNKQLQDIIGGDMGHLDCFVAGLGFVTNFPFTLGVQYWGDVSECWNS